MKTKLSNIMMASFAMLVYSLYADPVPVDEIYCVPGYESATTTNRQTITHIAISNDYYEVAGSICTACTGGQRAGTTNDIPSSNTEALSGAVITHAVVGITGGAKFDLGQTITNDNIGIVLGEIGATAQFVGDPINVYPLTNGVRVGSWIRSITTNDYGMFSNNQFKSYRGNPFMVQDLRPFLTTFRHSDFTNGSGTLTFDGIEINDTPGYDPNIVMTFGEKLLLETNKLPVTAMTFSPGFDEIPEQYEQTLTSITTTEGTFDNIEGLRCDSSYSGVNCFGAFNEGDPDNSTNALSGLRFTQGYANPGYVYWVLDSTITESDTDHRFFFGEISRYNYVNSPDSVTIVPVYEGSPVNDRSLVISTDDYGDPSSPWKSSFNGYEFEGTLVSFSLADFRSSPLPDPDIVVDGFRVNCNGKADPIIFGTYVVPTSPSPGTIILIH